MAPKIYQLLRQAEVGWGEGESRSQVLANISTELTQAGFVVDYVEARQPNLQPIEEFDRDLVLFIAAKLGSTRLIDNLHINFKT